jgi:hypothetical protein
MDGGTSFWRSPEFGAGLIARRWCASAVSPGSTQLGTAVADRDVSINVDDYVSSAPVNGDLLIDTCPDALTQIRRADGGILFMTVEGRTTTIRFEQRWKCDSGTCERNVISNTAIARVDEAVVDENQRSWVSGLINNQPQVVVVPPEVASSAPLPTISLAADVAPRRVELASAGRSIMAAWVAGDALTFARADDTSAGPAVCPVGTATLVDLVSGSGGSVAILTYGAGHNAIALFDGTTVSFFQLDLPFAFRPSVAHLGTKLRISGVCVEPDRSVCPSLVDNSIFEFPTKPDGGAW